MLYRIKNYINRKKFDSALADIKQYPAMKGEYEDYYLVSQICEKDITMFLMAYNSFVRYALPKKTFIIDDGSLSSNSILVLEDLIPNLIIKRIEEISIPPFPTNLCWERLILIQELIKESYVVQLDSDTLTIYYQDEVINNIKNNVSFTLGTDTECGKKIMSLADFLPHVLNSDSKHIQVESEKNLREKLNNKNISYVRGCAGLAGYARNSFKLSDIEDFFKFQLDLMGNDWNQWGCDQVTSNFIIANTKGATVLPNPTYTCYRADTYSIPVKFYHFIGSFRFKNNTYTNYAKKILKDLVSHKECGDIDVESGRKHTQDGWYDFAAEFSKDHTVIDIGCGLGKGIEILQIKSKSVLGQDIDERLANDNIIIQDIGDIEDKRFDTVTCIDVIEHIENDIAFVFNLCRIAKKQVLISTPNWTASRCKWPYHVREYTPKELYSLCGKYGKLELYKGTPNGHKRYRVNNIHLYFLFNSLRSNFFTSILARIINIALKEKYRINSHLFIRIIRE